MSWYKPWTWGDESQSAKQQRTDLNNQGGMASVFADQGQDNYNQMTAEASQARDQFRRLASGQDSLSSEQLRQGLAQNMAAQRSMAASASPANAPMAALHAAQNMGKLGAGMSGQAALAGIQERKAAQDALANMIMQQRGQDTQVALGSRQNATQAFGGVNPEKSAMEKYAGPAAAGLSAFAQLKGRGK